MFILIILLNILVKDFGCTRKPNYILLTCFVNLPSLKNLKVRTMEFLVKEEKNSPNISLEELRKPVDQSLKITELWTMINNCPHYKEIK